MARARRHRWRARAAGIAAAGIVATVGFTASGGFTVAAKASVAGPGRPLPGLGVITIRKELAGRSAASQFFRFRTNLTPGRAFWLFVNGGRPAQQSFVRPAGGPYRVTELVPPGWKLTGLRCRATGRPPRSRWYINGATVRIVLGRGNHVTCVYTNRPPPLLIVRKVTYGGAGGPFFFKVRGPLRYLLRATTKRPGVPVVAGKPGPPPFYVPGYYRVTEILPPPAYRGSWHFVGVSCRGFGRVPLTVHGTTATVRVRLTRFRGQNCLFRNKFRPRRRGTLQVIKRTLGPAVLRPGPAILSVVCKSAGGRFLAGRVVVRVGSRFGALRRPLVFSRPVTCLVREVSSGAAFGTRVRVRAVLVSGSRLVRVRVPGVFRMRARKRSTLIVTDVYLPKTVFCRSTAGLSKAC